jgi:hypothetical protein
MNIECKFDTITPMIISFLDRFRRAESVDPLHKWIGTGCTVRDQNRL